MILYDNGENGTAELYAGDTLGTWEDTYKLTCDNKPSNYDNWKARLLSRHHLAYGSQTTAEFDWIRVRKYASVEPSASVGDETAVPNVPENLQPSGLQCTTSPTLSAVVTDNDGDKMNVHFYDNLGDSLIDNV